MKRVIQLFSVLIASVLFLGTGYVFAQANVYPGNDATYANVINNRAKKIVDGLAIPDASKVSQVQTMIAKQYFNLNVIYTARDKDLKALKAMPGITKEAKADSLKNIENRVDAAVQALHYAYTAELQTNLSPKQVEGVKDGMTYSVLKVTYNAYMQMLPNLSAAQKNQIMTWLVEAREHAMDAGSSEKKHAWFGKYKGRINNYLSKAGIDMKQAEADWTARREAAKNKNS